jgi:hypothetical protein
VVDPSELQIDGRIVFIGRLVFQPSARAKASARRAIQWGDDLRSPAAARCRGRDAIVPQETAQILGGACDEQSVSELQVELTT